MKYILSEKQYNLLIEGKQEIFQSLLDNALHNVKKDCEDIDAETFPNDLSFSSCDEVEGVDKITIIEWDLSKLNDKSDKLYLIVNVEYQSVRDKSHDRLVFDIAKRINDWLNIPVSIRIYDEINTRIKEW